MTRAVPEWIGKTPNTKIPDRVKLRIWEREGGKCYLSGLKINPGDKHEYEHKIALCNGGENRESNIALALTKFHKAKTRSDVKEKAKVASVRKRHLGITRPKSGLAQSKFKKKMDGTVVLRATGEPV